MDQQDAMEMALSIIDMPSTSEDDSKMGEVIDEYEYYQARATNPEHIYIGEIV